VNVTAQTNSSCGVGFAGELMAAILYIQYMLYVNLQGSVVRHCSYTDRVRCANYRSSS